MSPSEFRPTLQTQHDDADAKDNTTAPTVTRLLTSLKEGEAS